MEEEEFDAVAPEPIFDLGNPLANLRGGFEVSVLAVTRPQPVAVAVAPGAVDRVHGDGGWIVHRFPSGPRRNEPCLIENRLVLRGVGRAWSLEGKRNALRAARRQRSRTRDRAASPSARVRDGIPRRRRAFNFSAVR